jgi:ABC-type transporter Mla maintaining outer membrane lipid asymmetry ATPase subunit MlaF
MPDEVLVRLRAVTKDYRGLRPLRIESLELRAGRSMALLGFDQAMAEVLVDLITGAILPDSGEISAFGRPTTDIADPDSWLSTLDQFGLLTDRAVLVEHFTIAQNLAVPLSLAVEDMPAQVRDCVGALAFEVGLVPELDRQTGAASPSTRARIRLGRALALAPRVLLGEHPNATLAREDAGAFAADISRIVATRGLASLVLTADHDFARSVATDVRVLKPSTGVLEPWSRWRRWFS